MDRVKMEYKICEECKSEYPEAEIVMGVCKECTKKIFDKVDKGVIKKKPPVFGEFN